MGILGAHVSHSFSGLSWSTKSVSSAAGGLSAAGVAKAMPPATSERSDSMVISTPLKRLRFTSTPLALQKREPILTRRAYRGSINTAVESRLSVIPLTMPTSMPR
jgi:hypothetical protein